MPWGIVGFAGVTWTETSTAAVTVSVVELATLLAGSVAVIVVVPRPALLARPWLPAALLIVATPVFAELQVTLVVRSAFEPSLKVPVAVNCWVLPSGSEGLTGVTASEVSTAAVTVNEVDPAMLVAGSVAVIVVTPDPVVVARPCVPAALLMVATTALEELHVTTLVRFWVEASLNVPVVVNCWS